MKRMVENLLHKELSYQIHGAAIEVRKDFGPGHKEKLYQEALAKELKRRNIAFEKEKAIKIYSPKDGTYIGLYRPDFVIDGKIIVEIKAEKFVSRDEIKRIYDYLRNSKYELACLINFASPNLFVKRIIFTNDRKPFHNLSNNTNRNSINNNSLKNTKLVSISLILVLFSGLWLFGGLWLFSGLHARAAQLNIVSQTQEIIINQPFQVDLILDTEGEVINAAEGKIVFSKELLEVKEIRDGDSIINLWIERPSIPLKNTDPLKDTNIDTNRHEIMFSGIIPTGFTGILSPYYEGERPGKILSLIFIPKKEGRGAVDIENGRVLLHDGLGTSATVKISNFQFDIKDAERPSISDAQYPEIEDKEPPEDFKPEITQIPEMFEGKYFLVFATQDKGSGIDRYEVYEDLGFRIQNLGKTIKKILYPKSYLLDPKFWKVAESPYLLKNQKLKSFIYVKAVDKAGNERVVIIEPRYPMKWHEQPLIWVIIILVLILSFVIVKKKIIH